jgi:hypothetical protein
MLSKVGASGVRAEHRGRRLRESGGTYSGRSAGGIVAMMRKSFVALLTLLVVVSSVMLFFVISYVRRAKQVRAFADLQTIAARVGALGSESVLSREAVEGAVRSVNRGQDPWGHAIIVETQETSTGLSYLLVSRGADGRLDVDEVTSYFVAEPRRVHGEYWRDIVFLDGRAITQAGK